MAMESEKPTAERAAAAESPAPARTDLPDLLRFLDTERRRSQRASFVAALFGVTIGALATAAWWTHAMPAANGGADPAVEAIAQRLVGLENASGTLAAQVRALVSRPPGGNAGDAAGERGAAAPRTELGDAAIAGKPSTQSSGDDERARRTGDEALARALERARQMPLVVNESVKPPEAAPSDVKPPPPPAEGEGAGDPKPDPAKVAAATEAVVTAFNGLLADCGLDQWHLMSAEVAAEDRALHKIVMAQRTATGTAYGSLTADRLALERDAGTGVSAFVLTGAHRTVAGVEEAFPEATTRLEIPGVLPLELVPAVLTELFGTAQNGAIGTTARVDLNDPLQVVRAINRILALEKGIALRIRSCARCNDDKLEKAVIDLSFDERGEAQQTVFADKAWFELDAKRDYVELCCDGGDMVVAGTRRPLFRGHLRWPLHSVTPPQWRGMPTLKLVSGS
jgi:hypothetical protein